MFASISKLFKRSEGRAVAERAPAAPVKQAARSTATARPAPKHAPCDVEAGERLAVPFKALLKVIPEELHGKKNASDNATGKFFISRQTVLEQIGNGSVRVKFGEIRRSAPQGLLTLSNTEDERIIDLPLGQLLPQLKPAELTRRAQQRVDVPTDIANLFGSTGEGFSGVRVITNERAGTTHYRKPAPGAPVPEEAPAPAPEAPARKVPSIAAARTAVRQNRTAAAAAGAHPETSAPIKIAAPAGLAAAMASPAPAPVQVHAPPPPLEVPSLDASSKVLSVTLTDLAVNWPESIRREIHSSSLVNAVCQIPASELSKSLKQGKVELPWKRIRSWLKPTVSAPSAFGETILQLPLEILAPIFLGQKPVVPQKKAEVAADIPDIFSRTSPISSAPAPAAPPPTYSAPIVAVPPPSAPAPAAPALVPAQAHTELRQAASSNTEFRAKTGPVPVSLSLLASNWPPNLVKEIDTQFLAQGKLEIPVDALEPGMRTGKVDFSWKQLCSWLQPEAPDSLIAAHADTRIELPLSIIAPLYLQRRPQTPKRAGITMDVPDLFQAGGPVPAAAPPEEEKRTPLGSLIAAPPAEPGNTEIRRRVQDLADLFGQPDKRNWTPNEIVQNTSALHGVAGALIALQDGLLVASCMPPEWRTETIAAFLPQIFGRMHQYTKELKMGELHSVTFTVDKGSVQIYAAGIIYFCVLSKAETLLPFYELNLIAKELSRHTK
jgi:predicted regulator of Ras-like GTPase activity (Roadblock/LC7/MglB family)